MDYGVHLPLMAFKEQNFSLEYLQTYAKTAQQLGFQAISANDHLLFSRPWIDGPTALAAVLGQTGTMALGTTVSLPIVRGPVPLAKTLGAIDLLSGGRLFVGVGPGSSPRDYAAVGIPFEERWKRLDEAIQTLRALWNKESEPFVGQYYATDEMTLEPYPAQQPGPPLWVGSWGSDAGLRRVARLGDGWLASAYNTTPEQFTAAWRQLREQLPQYGKDPEHFPNSLATMWLYLTEDKSEAEYVLKNILSPTLNRPEAELNERILIGSAHDCAEKLAAYQMAGVQRVFVWPIADDLNQIETFQKAVVPLVES